MSGRKLTIPSGRKMEALQLDKITMNEERFLSLLGSLIGQARTLQNNPSQGLCPREDNAGDIIMDALKPFSKEEGGPLIVERVHFTPGRGNIIIKYPGQGNETVSFVGSHMDVVPANPEEWTVDPFKLTRNSNDSDILYGRGTTDCLGHVALLTDLFCSLAELRPKLQRSVIAIFIVNEENQEVEGIGVDELDECGKLDEIGIKNGPVLWVDIADKNVCVGSVGTLAWSLEARGKMFHSGFPEKAINPIELVSEALAVIQRRFYETFPSHPLEKPVQIKCAQGSLNQIPGEAMVLGDIRITPFYSMTEVKEAVENFVQELNSDISVLPTRGHSSKYTLEDGLKGTLELKWLTNGLEGVACNLEGKGLDSLSNAIKNVTGNLRVYSMSGSLPLVRKLKDGGCDLLMTEFGLSSKPHAIDECCRLSDMHQGTRILANFLYHMEMP